MLHLIKVCKLFTEAENLKFAVWTILQITWPIWLNFFCEILFWKANNCELRRMTESHSAFDFSVKI